MLKIDQYNTTSAKLIIDLDKLRNVTKKSIRFLDNVIDANVYPSEEITNTVKDYRKVGLGVMGLADAFYLMKIPYNSDSAINLSKEIAETIQQSAHEASCELAVERGPFPKYEDEYVERYRFALNLKNPLQRNATVTTIAPTGTISMIAAVSSGIEPNFAIVYNRKFTGADESLYYCNPIFDHAINSIDKFSVNMSFENHEVLMKQIMDNGTVVGIDDLPSYIKKIFVTTHDIDYTYHVKHQGAWQKYVDNAVSKTINLCHDATVDDVKHAYQMAYEECKGVTVYRDGCRDSQVLYTGKTFEKKKEEKPSNLNNDTSDIKFETMEEKELPSTVSIADGFISNEEMNRLLDNQAKRIISNYGIRDRSEEVRGVTKKVKIGCGNLYITVNYDDKGICEVFTNTGKAGGCPSQSEASARLVSIALRGGIPITEIIKQLRGIRCPSCIRRKDIKVLSCPDAIGRYIEEVNKRLEEMRAKEEPVTLLKKKNVSVKEETPLEPFTATSTSCPECGEKLEFEGGCCICRNCGWSKCS